MSPRTLAVILTWERVCGALHDNWYPDDVPADDKNCHLLVQLRSSVYLHVNAISFARLEPLRCLPLFIPSGSYDRLKLRLQGSFPAAKEWSTFKSIVLGCLKLIFKKTIARWSSSNHLLPQESCSQFTVQCLMFSKSLSYLPTEWIRNVWFCIVHTVSSPARVTCEITVY